MRYKGGCHCAKIAFEVEGDLTEAIECNCSICYESGYLHWMIERSQLRMITPLVKPRSTSMDGSPVARRFWVLVWR